MADEKRNLILPTGSPAEKERVEKIIAESREAGMAGGVSRAGRAPGWDAHIKGRDSSKDQEDRELKAYRQYEGDIFLKHDDTSESTAVTIREKSVGLHTEDGKVGVLIKSNGNILVQGKPVFKVSGENIVKGDYSENPQSSKLYTYTETIEFAAGIKERIYEAAGKLGVDLSQSLFSGTGQLMTDFAGYPPHNHNMLFKHVHAVEPAYLFRMPAVGMMNKIKDMLETFTKLS